MSIKSPLHRGTHIYPKKADDLLITDERLRLFYFFGGVPILLEKEVEYVKMAAFSAAFLVGCLLAYAGYRLSRRALLSGAQKYASVSTAKAAAEALYLAGLFFLGQKTQLDTLCLLAGGALGATLPSFFFTAKLLKAADKNETDKEHEKENG